jgi:hypothetical protein
VLRIDTKEKLRAFHAMLGTTARYGVRKKRPKYNDGKALLSMNDVINVVLCPSQGDLASEDDSFQRFGVTDDGIDLAYDHSEGMLQIVIQYCKVVITCESLQCVNGVGVTISASSSIPALTSPFTIIPGMEFIDNAYLMRVHEVTNNEVRAKKIYKVDDSRGPTTVLESDVVIYTDIANVHSRIQQMLE